ncbi:LLM class flavin-dependent oxidoreductase [Mycolicibacterium diernhoferi]|nr:LLM class flavin-dependent oxidoreductase [Mycolicibacterium diernhoferi]QYL23777.1 LLM class flavin-dependent oxidoreductase [Mycolicibacterium diernhoferi]
MHVGLNLNIQNLGRASSDREAMAREMRFAQLAEKVGFDSLWMPEHHFTDYMLTPNVPQLLAWIAGQTETLRLGTSVSVLPWQDPIRTAESFVVLDNLSQGRAMLGLGRGLGRVEFDAFRLQMGESRRRFVEYSEAILHALETGVMEYDGDLYKQPRCEIRPEPYASVRGRTFASAVSPESMDIMARLGVGLMVIAQKPWPTVQADLDTYRARYNELRGEEPPKPLINVYVGVGETEAEATEMRERYLQNYALSTVEHYEFDNVGFEKIEGYEYYGNLARNIEKHGVDGFARFLADLQVWGTPDQVAEKLMSYVDRIDAGGIAIVPSYGGMSTEVANKNFDLIAEHVVPALKAKDVGGDLGIQYGVNTAAAV